MIAENLTFEKKHFFFGRTDMAEDEELMGLLKKAHLNRVLIGIESLNEKLWNRFTKVRTGTISSGLPKAAANTKSASLPALYWA